MSCFFGCLHQPVPLADERDAVLRDGLKVEMVGSRGSASGPVIEKRIPLAEMGVNPSCYPPRKLPLRFACPRTVGDFARGLWSSLNADNKVSLFARVIDLESGESGDMIYNKYDAVDSSLDDPEEPALLPEEME